MCLSRRCFLGTGLGGFFAFAMRHAGPALFAQEAAKAKAVIVLWMAGGPSQIDTFDPKPGVANGGGVKAIETASKELQIAANLPRTAKVMDKLSVIRTMTSPEGDHGRATTVLHTGRPFIEGVSHPAVGAVVSKEISDKPVTVPRYVTVGANAFGPAFLGEEHGPFTLENASSALETLRQLENRRGRFRLLDQLGQDFEKTRDAELVRKRQGLVERTAALLDTGFPKALDISKEPDATRDAYGRNGFGEGVLVARRLVEAGVRFVEVNLGGWDTHNDNAAAVARLCGALDPAMAALVSDLDKRGMLESTMVVWMGEFGRTPSINAANGRDHYPRAFSAVLGGGGIPGGRVVGSTGRTGADVERDPVQIADLFATLFERLGFDLAKKYRDAGGAVVKLTENGVPVKLLK